MSNRPHVKLSESDQQQLKELLSKGSLGARTLRRAAALLQLHDSQTYTQVAKQLGVRQQTVSIWASKYQEEGLGFLTDKARSGRPKKLSGVDKAKIVALACSSAPEGYDRWTLRLLADQAVELIEADSISYSEVRRILKKTNSSLT